MTEHGAAIGHNASFGSAGPRYYHYLMTACGVVGAMLFGAMALVVCADVLVRNIAHGSIPWSVEMTEYMLMTATFVAAPWLLYLGDHIRVDVFVRGLPPSARRWLGLATDLLGLCICAVLVWQAVVVALDSAQQGGLVFKVLIFPEWRLNLPMIFSFAMLTIEFARRLVLTLAGGAR